MYLDRMEILREVVAGLVPEEFHMAFWRANGSQVFDDPHCGTVGCAGGWLSMSDRIERLSIYPTEFFEGGEPYYFSPLADGGRLEYWGFDALRMALDLSKPQTLFIFDSLMYGSVSEALGHPAVHQECLRRITATILAERITQGETNIAP